MPRGNGPPMPLLVARCPRCGTQRIVVRTTTGLRIRTHYTKTSRTGSAPDAHCQGSRLAVEPAQTVPAVLRAPRPRRTLTRKSQR
jgi:hypothetical protein